MVKPLITGFGRAVTRGSEGSMNRVNSGNRVLELEAPPIRRVAAFFLSFLVAAAFAAVLPHTQAPTRLDTPSFLSSLLGRPVPTSSTPLHVAPGADLSLSTGSYSLSSRQGDISLSATGAGSAEWIRYANGASRKTPFGIETVTVSPRSGGGVSPRRLASGTEDLVMEDGHRKARAACG